MRTPKHYNNVALALEDSVITWLSRTGYLVITATKEENIQDDIDCWVRGRQFTDWVSVSIKSQAAGCATGDIYFEDVCEHNPGGDGWLRTGKADYYLILREPRAIPEWQRERYPVAPDYQPRYYLVSKQRVLSYLESGKPNRYIGLSTSALAQQRGRNSFNYFLTAGRLITPSDVEYLPEDWCELFDK